MSKRAGNFVMIEDVLDEIDADVLRLFSVKEIVFWGNFMVGAFNAPIFMK